MVFFFFFSFSSQPDEVDFPIVEGNADFNRRPYAYLGYWHWDLRPALWGVGKLDYGERFCAKFLLSIEDGNHDLPELLAHFVHKLACKVRKRSEVDVELDDIAFTVSGPFICGYIQFKATWLRSILEWTALVSDLWLTDQYGPVYYQTNALIINNDTLKAWHHLVDVACS